MIERRSFMAVMAGGLLATPLAAEAQTVGKVYRVGILSAANPHSASIYQAFEQRLRYFVRTSPSSSGTRRERSIVSPAWRPSWFVST